MGQGGNIVIVNATDTDLVPGNSDSGSMKSWNGWETISAKSSFGNYVEFDGPVFGHPSAGGSVWYSFKNTTYKFCIKAVYHDSCDIRVQVDDLPQFNGPAASQEHIDLGWDHNGSVTFIISGSGSSGIFFTASTVPPQSPDWMQQNLPTLQNRTLRQLCLPSSHDAGMSLITPKSTEFGNFDNCVTQAVNIGQQLVYGARFFDIRPVIGSGKYAAGHYSYVSALSSYQGAHGEWISDIVNEINAFTSRNAELVILELSHTFDTDSGYTSFTQQDWEGLFGELGKLQFLYQNPDASVDISQIPLSGFIGNKQAAVICYLADDNGIISQSQWNNLPAEKQATTIYLPDAYAGKGFFLSTCLNIYDDYADTDDPATMYDNQLKKLAKVRTSPNSQLFQLDWTLTLTSFLDNIGATTVLSDAATANHDLARYLFPVLTAQSYPNLISMDGINSTLGLAMSMYINLFMSADAVPANA